MGRRGRKRQLEVDARPWQLIESGVGTVQACRRVGIPNVAACHTHDACVCLLCLNTDKVSDHVLPVATPS